MISFIATCIVIVIVVLVAAFIIGAIGGTILGTARRVKKSPLKSIIALILMGWVISSASKYKKAEAEPPQQAITPAQTQQVAIPKNQPPITCTQTQKVNNPPPTNTLHRRIEIHVYGDYNITGIEDVIYRKMDTRPNASLIEKNITTGSGSTIFADIEWKESMQNPPEIKSTVNEIIDMSQNVDSTQRESIEKILARMQKPAYTRIDHDILNKPKPLSFETNQKCIEEPTYHRK